MSIMKGSALPAANLNVGSALAVVYVEVIKTVIANHWMVIPADAISPEVAIAVGYLISHIFDWYSGDNIVK